MINGIRQFLRPSSVDSLRGGIALKRNKPGLPINGNVTSLQVPATVRMPLLNYNREVLQPLVSVGQHVSLSDSLASGVVASVSGTVVDISPQPIAHPSGIRVPCVVIATDQSNAQEELKQHTELRTISLERIRECGVHGLGGAGFSTANKLDNSSKKQHHIQTLIINAVECEPLISCDESLIMTDSDRIVTAIQNIIEFTGCARCIVAMEDDKPQALKALNHAMSNVKGRLSFELKLLPSVYPAGAEKPLIERLTHARIPADSYPADNGIVCINVSTALAVDEARQGYPMISRIITIAGDLAPNPINVRVRFGTPIAEALKQTNNDINIHKARIRIGGPLSGFVINDLSVPVTATTNSIIVEEDKPAATQMACIRCSACSDICPVDLLPQQLFQYSVNENAKQAEKTGIHSCIECGCCDLVCPSNIPLTHSFRFLKGHIKEQHRQDALAQLAESRFHIREQRQQERKELRAKKREVAKQRLTSEKAPLADALERAKQRRRKKTGNKNNTGFDSATGDNNTQTKDKQP